MALPTILEKLNITEEKNILIQGLPSAIERPFSKLNFSKSVTPLLRTKRIDFALIFAFSVRQLALIIDDVIPALNDDAIFWVAYPKPASKIKSELSRDYNWEVVTDLGFEPISHISMDSIWLAIQFSKGGRLVEQEEVEVSYSQS